ncbi:AraC family transcriptional regulator [Dyadobacter sp. 3J3]|uniref:helix-turn-helix domain-containing protein n=1 Tax=Dyadobacter sp. 3J3 TaxID=2606600 RepID=UPI0013579F2F|nr:response regulator transcription factor [Dyadobacter sp. 3J3]
METDVIIALPPDLLAGASTEHELPEMNRYLLPKLPVKVTRWTGGCMRHQQWVGENFIVQILVLDVKKTLAAELAVKNTNTIFFYVLKGYFQCKSKQQTFQIRNGEFSILGAQPERYELRLVPGSHVYFFFYLRQELTEKLAGEYTVLLQLFNKSRDHEITAYGGGKVNRQINRIMFKLKQIVPDGKITDHKAEGLLLELVGLCQHWKEDQDSVPTKTTRDLVQEVRGYVDSQTLEGTVTIKEVADIFSLTPERLGQVFGDLFGVSLREYIVTVRMNEAYRLLTQHSMSVTDVAETLGYTSPFNFSRRFKSHFGYPPSDAAKRKSQSE